MEFKINVTNETANWTTLAEVEQQARKVNDEMNRLRKMMENLTPVTIEFREEGFNHTVACEHHTVCGKIKEHLEQRATEDENGREGSEDLAREIVAGAEEAGLPWYAGLFNPKLWTDKSKAEERTK